MSSHHFVKEGQEPALLIAGQADYRLVEPLLQWSPFIMVLDDQLEKVLSWGINVDIVLCAPGNSESVKTHLAVRHSVTVIQWPGGSNPFREGLVHLAQRGEIAVNVFCDSLEDVRSIAAEFSRLPGIVVYSGSVRWILVKQVFRKWVPTGTRFSIAFARGDQDVSADGVQESDREFVATEGWVSFSSQQEFWLGEILK